MQGVWSAVPIEAYDIVPVLSHGYARNPLNATLQPPMTVVDQGLQVVGIQLTLLFQQLPFKLGRRVW